MHFYVFILTALGSDKIFQRLCRFSKY